MKQFRARLIAPDQLSEIDKTAWLAMLADQPLWQSPLLRPEFSQKLSAFRSDLWIGIIDHDDRPVLYFPHHRPKGRVMRPAGAPLSDYVALITTPDPGLNWAQALSLLGIHKLPAMGVIDPYGLCAPLERPEVTGMIIDTDPLASIAPTNKKLHKNINRLTRNLALHHGELEWSFDDRDPAVFEMMIALKRTQLKDQGLHDYLASPWIKAFLRSLFDDPDKQGFNGCLFSLKVKDVPILMQFGPRFGPIMHPWISSYNPDYYAYSPGQIFLDKCSEILRQNGIKYYDLSTGADHYKKLFATKTIPVQCGTLRSSELAKHNDNHWIDIKSALPPSLQVALTSLQSRLDHIDAVESDLKGRIHGLVGIRKIIPAHFKGLRRARHPI